MVATVATGWVGANVGVVPGVERVAMPVGGKLVSGDKMGDRPLPSVWMNEGDVVVGVPVGLSGPVVGQTA